MDQHKPLSYLSLKCVIQYMDSSFRLVRSFQIPSLRKIQTLMPLKFDVLELNDSTFTFDNAHFWYRHCRQFIERDGGGTVNSLHSEYDLNDDGYEKRFQDLMPGDIVIKDRNWKGYSKGDEKFISDSYVLCRVRTDLNNQYLECQSQYGINLRDMMRKTLHKVLGGKRIHQVQHLKIGVYHGVLRLPEGLKLQIRELSIRKNSMAVIDAILPILDVSSFPLKSLSICLENPEDPVIQSEILRTSESLTINNRAYFDNRWANVLINLPNLKIHLKNQINVNHIVLIVRNWMQRSQIIGTRFSMQAVSVKEHLNEIKKVFNIRKGVLPEKKCTKPFPCFTLPMTSTSELNIYRDKSPNYKEEPKKGMGKPYMIVLEVMPIGTAKPLKDQ